MAWEIIQLADKEKVAKAYNNFKLLGFKEGEIDPYQNLAWILDDKDYDKNKFYCTYTDQHNNCGYCVLRKHMRPVKLQLGEVTIAKREVYRFELWAEPVLKLSLVDQQKNILNAFLCALDAKMATNDVLSIEGLTLGSVFYQCVTNKVGHRLSLQLGEPFMHQSINFPDTLEGYLKQMSKRSRKSVQYSQRKIAKDFQTELFECNSEHAISQFLDDAISVSKKTYQWNLLGLGLRDRQELKDSLLKWHRQANLKCYLLYCDQQPVAFMLGYIYQSCYYYVDVGYDPDWAKYSVGSVLQLAVIEKLYEMELSPKIFDFSTGYGEHKGRFGNAQQEEVNLLLMSASLKNRAFVGAYKLVNGISSMLVGLLEKIGIKKQIKKMIRRFF